MHKGKPPRSRKIKSKHISIFLQLSLSSAVLLLWPFLRGLSSVQSCKCNALNTDIAKVIRSIPLLKDHKAQYKVNYSYLGQLPE